MESLTAGFFVNPIAAGGSPDPFVVFWEGHYHSVSCHGKDGRSVAVSRARRLVDVFNAEKATVYTGAEDGWAVSHWAPELHWRGGRWYVYTCALGHGFPNHRRRVVVLRGTGRDPRDPFEFAAVLDTGDFYSLDASPFTAPNGKGYLMWSSTLKPGVDNPCRLYLAEMGDPVTMRHPGQRWPVHDLAYPWEGTVNEGSAILVGQKGLHVFFSANAFDSPAYCLGLLSCPDATPPDCRDWKWTKSPEPVLSRADGVYGPGHNCFTVSPDGMETWIVFHAKPSPETGAHRVACAQRLLWQNGLPTVAKPVAFGMPVAMPSGD